MTLRSNVTSGVPDGDLVALVHLDVEAIALELHGVDADMDQDLDTAVEHQAERVTGRLSRDDDPVPGGVRGVT